jgi:hypothetical protein
MLHLSSDTHFGAHSSRPVRRHVSLVKWHAPSLWSITRGHKLINGRGVSSAAVCPSNGPPPCCSSPLGTYSSPAGHHITRQFNTPPIPPAVYIYSGRAFSSVVNTETRWVKRASYYIHLLPASQLTHADTPVIIEYVPVQHRHASLDRHEAVRATVLHQVSSAARRHAHILHLSSTPPFTAHTLVGQ